MCSVGEENRGKLKSPRLAPGWGAFPCCRILSLSLSLFLFLALGFINHGDQEPKAHWGEGEKRKGVKTEERESERKKKKIGKRKKGERVKRVKEW